MSVQPVVKKYTVGSVGIWEKIRRFLAVDPERSSGIPLNQHFRNPAPASVPASDYTDPVTVPAADIAENPYWKRDTRRDYPQLSTLRQSDIAGLLTVGSVANPRIGTGAEGEKQLATIKEDSAKGVLSLAFEKGGAKSISEVLGAGGLPPLPGNGMKWTIDSSEGYPSKYPCRTLR
ncbi:21 kDa subunit of NADH dehydrogenase [Morchella conica CCBAS932]|uniref:21 kDa subunit of NADH dehydrogenase n=1 Tax=Morchella conica CCBAS932 TaxID=1392247 RepID=A0A3N4KIY2_9PEZI|nr:21 kDa subunit of NADH dehydrogenase [Morchella conica CCBAS932]